METYIKLYDWMVTIPPTERMVYALIYQMTIANGGCWMTAHAISQRLGIKKAECKRAIQSLSNSKAIFQSKDNNGRKTLYATKEFADSLVRAHPRI